MDSLLLERLDRIDRALNSLVDSISSYNPSIAAVIELVAADDQLTEGIYQLVNHQANTARIHSLRDSISKLDGTIKDSLIHLASVRQDVLAIPLDAALRELKGNNVRYRDLVDYASKISRYTIPPKIPDGVPQGIPHGPASQVPGEQAGDQISTMEGAPPESGPQIAQISNMSHEASGFGVKQLQEAEVQWLHPERLVPFLPWPTEEVIQRGALAAIDRGEVIGEDLAQPQKSGGDMEVDSSDPNDMSFQEQGKQLGRGRVLEPTARTEQKEEKPRVFEGLDLYDPDMEA